jgi:Ca2+:H+ antiporter
VSIIGSLLANLLLTLGLSTILSSSKNARSFHYFNVFTARVSGSLLALILASFLIPTVFAAYLNNDDTNGPATDALDTASVSRSVSVLLALMYLCLLVHQFRTHRSISSVPPERNTPPKHKDPKKDLQGVIGLGVAAGLQASVVGLGKSSGQGCYATKTGLPTYFPITSTNEKKPKLHLVVAITLFIITAGLLAACVEFTVQSIDELTSQAKISQTFVGLILVPIPNCDLAPISHAREGDFQKSIDLTVGKCLQTTLFVYPLCVITGWGLGIPYADFDFDIIHVSYIFATVFLLNLPLRRGRISWYAIMPLIIE